MIGIGSLGGTSPSLSLGLRGAGDGGELRCCSTKLIPVSKPSLHRQDLFERSGYQPMTPMEYDFGALTVTMALAAFVVAVVC